MNIAITLPETLWKKIVSGEKTIELRKNFPKEFDVNTDRVYVCLKGTELVAGFFTVLTFEPCIGELVCSYPDIPKRIAVPNKWIKAYVKNKSWSWVYLWQIDNVVAFKGVGNHRSLYHIKKNPQSFVYIQ